MRRTSCVGTALRPALALALLCAAVPALSAAAPALPSTATPHPAARLVQLDRAPTAVERGALRAAGATLIERDLRIWRVPSRAVPRVVPALTLAGLTRRVEVDRPLEPLAAGPTPPAVDPHTEWWLRTIGAAGLIPPGPGKPVTVVDTGVDVGHPENAGKHITLLNAQVGIDLPGDFHGTAVSSLIAARGAHVVGVYPNAVLREWDASPTGQLSLSKIIKGIDAATTAGPGVINLSLGGPIDDALLRATVLDAVHRGSLVVAAQGEDRIDGSPPAYPADESHVLAVVATDRHNVVYIDSNGSEGNDLSAPGVQVKVAVPPSASPSGYEVVTGNSFAAAIVSGAAAWLWTRRPSLDPTQVFGLLVGTAREIGNARYNTVSGYGLLDLPAALAAPAPPPAPYEPNDEISMIRPGALFADGEPLLTTASRRHAFVRGALYSNDNPRDVFRVWIPAKGSLSATATPQSGKLSLRVWSATTRSVLEGGAARRQDLLAAGGGDGAEHVRVANDSSRGTVAYVELSLDGSQTGKYALALSTSS